MRRNFSINHPYVVHSVNGEECRFSNMACAMNTAVFRRSSLLSGDMAVEHWVVTPDGKIIAEGMIRTHGLVVSHPDVLQDA